LWIFPSTKPHITLGGIPPTLKAETARVQNVCLKEPSWLCRDATPHHPEVGIGFSSAWLGNTQRYPYINDCYVHHSLLTKCFVAYRGLPENTMKNVHEKADKLVDGLDFAQQKNACKQPVHQVS
jgi:hypothetical protein